MYRRVRALKLLVPVLRVVLPMTTYSSFRNSHPRWQHVCFFLKQLCDCLNPFFSCTTMVPLTKLLEQVIRQTRQLSLYFREGSATLHFLWKTRKKRGKGKKKKTHSSLVPIPSLFSPFPLENLLSCRPLGEVM